MGVQDLLAEQEVVTPQLVASLLDPSQRLIRKHRTSSGAQIDMEVTGAEVDFHGRPALLVVANNVTERLKNEAQLRHNERLDAVGSLTGGIAHDFNNLLTVIKATAEDLISELGDSPMRQSAEMALEAADRGAELVRHLMAFARKQELTPTQINVNTLTEAVVKLIRRTLPSNISIKFVKKDGLPLVNMDAGRLENALLNLAVNARDAMPDGGELVLETSMAELDSQYARENSDVQAGRYVLVAISDTGTGMPQEVIDHAFEPFFTTKGVGKGTGLGLSMVYGLIKQSGGHAKIYSVVGKGTTIKLYLPVGAATEKSVEKSEAAPAPTGEVSSGRILLVEDDELVRKSVTVKLKRLGYDITPVNSAAEAVAMLEQTSDFKLMLSDVMMPGTMTGADLAREVQHRWPHIGVLLSSGYTESSIGGKVRIPDGVRLLSKPYSNSDLASALKETLAKQVA
jgi:signal transduction histidine kinase/ActR/RegA family two-component response regulator